jgi:capsular exopolysaccharide synthesis family protein
VSLVQDTGNLVIKVRLESPELAAQAANQISERVVRFSATDSLLRGERVSVALPPTSPSSPPRRLLEAAALVIGLILGIAVSLLVERGRPRYRSSREVAAGTGYTLLGRVPPSRLLRASPREAFSDPAVSSAFRALRVSVQSLHGESQENRVLMVTSPHAGDGKTTVAAPLAEALARAGARVLLIDADLRHPQIGTLAGMNGDRGLAAVLHNACGIEAATRPGWIKGLSLLPTVADPDAGDLLAQRFGQVIDRARPLYDIVILDAPPILAIDDAQTMATAVDSVILVVRKDVSVASVNDAILMVEGLRVELLGIVTNRFKEPGSYYF